MGKTRKKFDKTIKYKTEKLQREKDKKIKKRKKKKMNKTIISLYDHFKNTTKKLKIVCDWDEVIQSAYPYAHYLAMLEKTEENKQVDFATYFNNYWQTGKSEHGIKNTSDIYYLMPFLTIAEDLLKLIKENKIEKLIFLSTSDDRKRSVFKETFYKLDNTIELYLISEEMYKQPGANTKIDWIKYNAKEFDVFIDDDPENCKSVIRANDYFLVKPCKDCMKQYMGECHGETEYSCGDCKKMNFVVFTPHYPALESQHDEKVLLVKNKVSNLKREDFKI